MCPQEIPRFTALGLSAIVSAAFSSSGLALVFQLAEIKLPFSLNAIIVSSWMALLLSVNRLLISVETSTTARSSPVSRLIGSVFSLLFAVGLGLAVAEPLALTIFRADTVAQLAADHQAEIAQAIRPIEPRLNAAEVQLDRLRQQYISEATGKPAIDPGSAPKLSILQSAIDEAQAQVEQLQRQVALIGATISSNEGVSEQAKALGNLARSSTSVALAIWFTRAISFAVIFLPRILALITGRGSIYTTLLELRDREVVAAAREEFRMALKVRRKATKYEKGSRSTQNGT
jgi:hypothetical protein